MRPGALEHWSTGALEHWQHDPSRPTQNSSVRWASEPVGPTQDDEENRRAWKPIVQLGGIKQGDVTTRVTVPFAFARSAAAAPVGV